MSEELRHELDELVSYICEQGEILRVLDRELDPYWRRQRQLKEALIKTHPWISGYAALRAGLGASPEEVYVTGYGRADRAGLFAEMDRLAEVTAPTRIRRREVKAEIEAACRAADRIREALAKPKKARAERAVTPDLFSKELL